MVSIYTVVFIVIVLLGAFTVVLKCTINNRNSQWEKYPLDAIVHKNGNLKHYVNEIYIPSLVTYIVANTNFKQFQNEATIVLTKKISDTADKLTPEWFSEYYLQSINKNSRGTYHINNIREQWVNEIKKIVLEQLHLQ